MDSTWLPSTGTEMSRKLARRWRELCTRFLPVAPEGSVWRYNRGPHSEDPEQGWKLHVSATVLNAHTVLERVAPLLVTYGVQFKAPSSLAQLSRLNSGLYYPYSQVGKVITVYPRTDEEALFLARGLHEQTRRLSAPAVPFDIRYRPKSNVYYRYGAFKAVEIEQPDGGRVPAMRDPSGNLVPDLCGPGPAQAEWIQNPFPRQWPRRAGLDIDNPLKKSFRVFRALSQRGKGGVYQAIDISAEPPRLCLLKEGRKAGELGWDGRDGRWRVRYEERVLASLRERGVNVPRVYSSFELGGNYYLVTEFIDGENLQTFLLRQQRRIPIARVLQLAIQLSGFMAQIHAAGWVWRDCKPANLILTKQKELRSLDFEGACPIDRASMRWITPGFTPKSRVASEARSGVFDDLYALGAVIYLLLTGRMPASGSLPIPIIKMRRNTPEAVCELVSALLYSGARRRLDAVIVSQRLEAALSRLNPKPGSRSLGAARFITATGVGD